MSRRRSLPLSLLALLLSAGLAACGAATGGEATRLPAPALDPAPTEPGYRTAVFAGGCFWGVESVFEHVRGVRSATSGYAGGQAATATYEQVSEGDTGHAESVKVVYDPRQVSYGQLLEVFFGAAHDPTQLDRQGPDRGTQYRSAIFYADAQQQRVADAYIAQLAAAHAFEAPIVTRVVPLAAFYTAEPYHQDYARLHPNEPYIVYNDAPKVASLRRLYPALYRPEQDVVQVELH